MLIDDMSVNPTTQVEEHTAEPNQKVIGMVVEQIEQDALALLKQDPSNKTNPEYRLLVDVSVALGNVNNHDYLKKILMRYQDPSDEAQMIFLADKIRGIVKERQGSAAPQY